MSVAQTCSCLQRGLRVPPSPPSAPCPGWVPGQGMGRRDQDVPWCLHIMARGLQLTVTMLPGEGPSLSAGGCQACQPPCGSSG